MILLTPKKDAGFTLLELMLIIAVMSMLLFIMASSRPVITEERKIALTIARTSQLLDSLYAEFTDAPYGPEKGWNNYCQLPSKWPKKLDKNSFGYEINLSEDCNEGYIEILQDVPTVWAQYMVNHLENTQIAIAGEDITKISTKLDVYGNLIGGVRFVRKQFESEGDIFRYIGRHNPDEGATKATILKPVCADGKQAVISYRAKGICSFYPRHLDPENTHGFPANEREGYEYQTNQFRFRLESVSNDLEPGRWEIYAETAERWKSRVRSDDGSTWNYTAHHGWAAAQELCKNHMPLTNLEENDDNRLLNFPNLLTVDAWVGCQ